MDEAVEYGGFWMYVLWHHGNRNRFVVVDCIDKPCKVGAVAADSIPVLAGNVVDNLHSVVAGSGDAESSANLVEVIQFAVVQFYTGRRLFKRVPHKGLGYGYNPAFPVHVRSESVEHFHCTLALYMQSRIFENVYRNAVDSLQLFLVQHREFTHMHDCSPP